jgi:hypothetical protein
MLKGEAGPSHSPVQHRLGKNAHSIALLLYSGLIKCTPYATYIVSSIDSSVLFLQITGNVL